MPLTVRELVSRGELGLSVAAGAAGLDRPISWVHASEVPDPTPWLDPGSLVLTTGLGHDGPASLATLARRLDAAGAAGLGIGVDVVHTAVPEEVVRAGDSTGLPVLVVPYATPFVAIARAVARRVAEEERAALQRALDVHRRLTGAVLDHGAAPGAVRVLARELGGRAAVVDRAGRCLAAGPEDAAGEVGGLLDGLRPADGRRRSLSVAGPRRHLLGYPLGTEGTRGHLLVWRESPFAGTDHGVVAAAASLVTYELELQRSALARARRSSADAVREVLREGAAPATAARLVTSWGIDPERVVVILLGRAPEAGDEDAEDVHDVLADQDVPALACSTDWGETVLLTTRADLVIDALRASAERRGRDLSGGVGVSDVLTAAELADGLRQARQALAIGRKEGRTVTSVRDLSVVELLLASAERSIPETLVRRLVDPLRRAEEERGVPLVATVRAFLEHNGSVADASAELGVHRHTLRSRLDAVRQVLGRDLDSSYVRLELAIALQAQALRADSAD
ncbi:PucR family transcriptional regulator [Marinitenerispora sediminis]|nr:PucR family transcriptional regulator [Marinitenerispora sediminis]